MTGLYALWLPILLSSVLLFIVSWLIHMAMPWHKGDYPRVPDEERFRDAVRPLTIPPGDYMVPRAADGRDMRSPGFLEKMKQGPVVVMTVMPNGPMPIGTNLVYWFLYLVVVGVFAGYVAGRALPPGADYLSVFRFVGAVAFTAYTLALWQMTILVSPQPEPQPQGDAGRVDLRAAHGRHVRLALAALAAVAILALAGPARADNLVFGAARA